MDTSSINNYSKKDSVDSWTHSINKRLLDKASENLNIPIIYVECAIDDYEEKFEEKLIEAKKWVRLL